jgi:hypothetical protein
VTTRLHFPGSGLPAVDDRLVAPGSRAEILDGRVLLAPPADEGHAVPHADLAYVLRAHARAEFLVAVDLLTRTSQTADLAPDASVYPRERVPETGGRKLDELAFEIVSEQPLGVPTGKARELARRGVRRIFCLVVKQRRLLEWSRETDGWSAAPVERIDDPCFVRPLPAVALLEAVAADEAVMKALREKRHPEFLAEREEGREEGLSVARRAVRDLCTALGVEVDTARGRDIDTMDTDRLDALRAALVATRRWPGG